MDGWMDGRINRLTGGQCRYPWMQMSTHVTRTFVKIY